MLYARIQLRYFKNSNQKQPNRCSFYRTFHQHDYVENCVKYIGLLTDLCIKVTPSVYMVTKTDT